MAMKAVSSSGNGNKQYKQNPYKAFSEATEKFKEVFISFVENLHTKIEDSRVKVKTFDTQSLKIENGTVHIYGGGVGLSSLTLTYPGKDSFISTVIFSTVAGPTTNDTVAPVPVTFPQGTQFVGANTPVFYPNEKWELSILNGIVACSRIVER